MRIAGGNSVDGTVDQTTHFFGKDRHSRNCYGRYDEC